MVQQEACIMQEGNCLNQYIQGHMATFVSKQTTACINHQTTVAVNLLKINQAQRVENQLSSMNQSVNKNTFTQCYQMQVNQRHTVPETSPVPPSSFL